MPQDFTGHDEDLTAPDYLQDAKESSSRPVSVEKSARIVQACLQRNLDELARLADAPGGLVNDELRQQAWPILLGCELDSQSQPADNDSWRKLPRHQDEDQVQLDVNRSFIYYPRHESEKTTSEHRAALSDLIVQTLRLHPMLCYFQGYHDIVQVLFLVLGPVKAAPALARVSLLRIRDYMLPTLAPALKQLQLLPAILRAADPEVAAHLSQTRPFFALSATLTLYAHDIEEYGDIARLFDFILAHEPVMTIYLFAAIIVSRRKKLLGVPGDEPDMLQFTLTKLLADQLDLEDLLNQARQLFLRHPPERLPGFIWWRLSSLSVLKTCRSLHSKQTLEDGEILFRQQVQQMKREDAMQKALVFVSQNRRPILSVSTAVLIGALSVYLSRTGHGTALWFHLWKSVKSTRFKPR